MTLPIKKYKRRLLAKAKHNIDGAPVKLPKRIRVLEVELNQLDVTEAGVAKFLGPSAISVITNGQYASFITGLFGECWFVRASDDDDDVYPMPKDVIHTLYAEEAA